MSKRISLIAFACLFVTFLFTMGWAIPADDSAEINATEEKTVLSQTIKLSRASLTRLATHGSQITMDFEVPWYDVGNITGIGSHSALYWPLGAGDISGYLVGTGFGFRIPANATIDGVEAVIYWYDSAFTGDHAKEKEIRLYNNGVAGDNKSTSADIPVPTSLPCTTTYGGSSDCWGL